MMTEMMRTMCQLLELRQVKLRNKKMQKKCQRRSRMKMMKFSTSIKGLKRIRREPKRGGLEKCHKIPRKTQVLLAVVNLQKNACTLI